MRTTALALHVLLAAILVFLRMPGVFAEGILHDPLKDGSNIQKVQEPITAAKQVASLPKAQQPAPVNIEIPNLPKVQPPMTVKKESPDILKVQPPITVRTPEETVEKFVKEINIWHGGFNRTYLIHVPPSYKSSTETPLVVAFHGAGGYSRIMAADQYYGWISKSDKEGFIVAFPNGASPYEDGRFGTWNAGKCCAYARDYRIDDVDFVRDVVLDIQAAYKIDRTRIFATGMSNGGMFSYTLACNLPDVFRAAASVAGTDNNIECRASKAVSILHIHAKDDDHVLFNGGAGPNVYKDKSKVTEFTSVPATMSMWLKRDGCMETPKRIVDVPGAYCDLYSQCNAGTQVQLCVTEKGGHSWPGAKATPLKKPHNPSNAINATDVIWDFFHAQK